PIAADFIPGLIPQKTTFREVDMTSVRPIGFGFGREDMASEHLNLCGWIRITRTLIQKLAVRLGMRAKMS
ncbi:MAG: hypothetical protein ABSD59_26470, partial [Terracidiphilus sp.]